MAITVSIQMAARNALASWLSSQLSGIDGGITVEPRWFERDRLLPAKVVTIVDAGPRRIEWLEPTLLLSTNNAGSPPTATSTWQLGLIEQPLQLDAWARDDVSLDDIISRLDAALNKGFNGIGVANSEPFAPGVLLNLADGWSPGTADFLFDSPDIDNTPDSVGIDQWRASYRGIASMRLVETATTARMAQINIKLRLRTQDPDDPTQPYDIVTLTANGESHSTGP